MVCLKNLTAKTDKINIKLTDAEIVKIAKESTYNPDSNKVMLGKYDIEGANSYDKLAEKNYTFFQMSSEQWDSLSPLGRTRTNNTFLRQQVVLNKDIYISHSPLNLSGSSKLEIQELKNKYGTNEFKQVDNLWKVFE